MYATSLTPTAPGVIGTRATIPTIVIAASTAAGARTSGGSPTAIRASSNTTNQASLAAIAAPKPIAPCCDRMSFERTRNSRKPSTIPEGGVRPNRAQIHEASRSSRVPSPRATDSERTIAVRASAATPRRRRETPVTRISREVAARPLAKIPMIATSGRASDDSGSKREASASPALADSTGTAHCRYRTDLIAMSLGPGIVLATARPTRSAVTARGHERPLMRARAGPALATYATRVAAIRPAS
jgi:hypothetical protein